MKILDLRHRGWIILPAIIIIGLFALLPNPVNARPRQAITLLYFEGTGQDNAILLEWETATEFETAGFILQRANSESGTYENLDQIGFIPGEGDGIIGAEYAVIDDMNVVNGQTYWYILVEIENGGSQNPTDPISVTGGVATATPTNTPTTQPTSANNQTTPTATQTRTPTPTNTAPASATAVPTNTQVPNQPTSAPNATTQPTATTTTGGGNSSTGTTNSTSSGGNVAEASSPTDPYPAQGSPSPTFVPDPNSPNPTADPATDPAALGYPAPGEETNGAAYPAGTEPTAESAAVETPAIQPQGGGDDVRELSTQPPLNPPVDEKEAAQQSGSSNTLFLWVGFTAALLIFAGGIIGSMILFTRRSNQK